MVFGCGETRRSTQGAWLAFGVGVLANIVVPRRFPNIWRNWKRAVRLGTVGLPIAIATLGRCFEVSIFRMSTEGQKALNLSELADWQIAEIKRHHSAINWVNLLHGQTKEEVVAFVDRIGGELPRLFISANAEQQAALLDRDPTKERRYVRFCAEVPLYVTEPELLKQIEHLSIDKLYPEVIKWPEKKRIAWFTMMKEAEKDLLPSAEHFYINDGDFDETFGKIFILPEGSNAAEVIASFKLPKEHVVKSLARLAEWNEKTERPANLTLKQLIKLVEFIPNIAGPWLTEVASAKLTSGKLC